MPGSADGPTLRWTIEAQGDRCLEIGFGRGMSIDTGRQCARAAAALRRAEIEGITDVVPTFNAVAVHYQPNLTAAGSLQDSPEMPHALLAARIEAVLDTLRHNAEDIAPARIVDIPVCYGDDYGPDLTHVAQHCGIDPADVIRLHSQQTAYVFMLGFAPGAPYIGVHDEKLDIGRRSTPRTRLPAGSVAIANRQTMIYPNASPGGWHIIGATPVVLFDPGREPATLLAPGDSIRFIPITAAEYERLLGARA
ncbi:5-oxoprolinase subunit PxpB [Allopusillimonas ginsengisoli]|uniref:5-oxoprolinase subunit PxpB n=1 Tax=Allopusillimonas ginsengisoli TaxID=453575 RepID=UPI0010206ACC|nr:5-oxoprolinase subunit PxpB [Allopusillimonas ginsengisoli]TEA78306.1 5-oxoprolinase subunit PxpB [Allopusillimonas ginsengisoli]